MSLFELLHVAAVAVLLLPSQTRTTAVAEACRCDDLSACETFENADVVLRGTVIQARAKRRCVKRRCRSRPKGRIVYTIEVIDLLKGEPGMSSGQEIKLYSEDGGDDCLVTLNEGDEYLLDLIQTGDGLLANPCGLVEEWGNVQAGIRADVGDGCGVDNCEAACGEFQECLLQDDGQYFCADVCDPSPCSEDEVCSLRHTICADGPCPRRAACTVLLP